ncbi:MAG: hypothetical protein ACM3P0_16840 [Acidobacteriota bacterium]
MSLRIPAIFMVLSLLIFSACCNSRPGTESKQAQNVPKADTLQKQSGGSKTVIQENSSLITAEVLEVKPEGNNNFRLKVLVKDVEDDGAYESLVVKGEKYLMEPGFTMDGKEIKPIDKNRKLMELKDLSPKSSFRARVSLTQGNKWVVQEVLDAKEPVNK